MIEGKDEDQADDTMLIRDVYSLIRNLLEVCEHLENFYKYVKLCLS